MRLIDVDAIPWQECLDTNGYAEPLDKVISVIQNMPTIEAEPKHGHWIRKNDGIYDYYECSVCGRWVDPIPNPQMVLKAFPYCHCGAKMDEVEE